jgi:hypothetical protein
MNPVNRWNMLDTLDSAEYVRRVVQIFAAWRESKEQLKTETA